jgi:hypothetical protein
MVDTAQRGLEIMGNCIRVLRQVGIRLFKLHGFVLQGAIGYKQFSRPCLDPHF